MLYPIRLDKSLDNSAYKTDVYFISANHACFYVDPVDTSIHNVRYSGQHHSKARNKGFKQTESRMFIYEYVLFVYTHGSSVWYHTLNLNRILIFAMFENISKVKLSSFYMYVVTLFSRYVDWARMIFFCSVWFLTGFCKQGAVLAWSDVHPPGMRAVAGSIRMSGSIFS